MSLVRVVDDAGRFDRHEEKLAAHVAPGLRHEAFSVFVRDSGGKVLLQRRADDKYHFAGLWGNACCSHPVGDRPVAELARTRLEEEMGLDLPLLEIGTFEYRAVDPVSGLVEWEFDHVLIGRTDDDPFPDPLEVSEWAWVSPSDLRRRIGERDPTLAPWLVDAIGAFPSLVQ